MSSNLNRADAHDIAVEALAREHVVGGPQQLENYFHCSAPVNFAWKRSAASCPTPASV